MARRVGYGVVSSLVEPEVADKTVGFRAGAIRRKSTTMSDNGAMDVVCSGAVELNGD